MRIGIDFGTSYTAAAALVDDAVVPISFGQEQQFRTAVFFPETVPDPADFELTPRLEAQVEEFVRSARAERRRSADGVTSVADEDALRRDAIRAVRRQWLEEQVRSARSAAVSAKDAVFGDEAIDAYLSEGTGNLVQSPKSMLGYKLFPQVRKTMVNIVTHVLEHVRLSATHQLQRSVRGAVIGRPVEFRSSMGDAGRQQALDILREAAAAAGFDEVTFLEEPAAAAMYHHARSPQRHSTVVVDVGGGTTDIAYADIGGTGAAPLVHRSWGLPRGGTDVDLNLSLNQCMPLFGRGLLNVPVHQYVDAASVHDIPRQREFRAHRYADVVAPYGPRLIVLQQPGMATRLNRDIETLKIHLSEMQDCVLPFDYIEPGLAVGATRAHLDASAEPFLQKLAQLLQQVSADLPAAPQGVFLTGGMSRAPYVRELVRQCFPGVAVTEGDPSFGVVSGLALAAGRS